MKTAVYLFIMIVLSVATLYAAINMVNPFPAYGLLLCSWALFIWGYTRRLRRNSQRHFRERMFEEYMRNSMHNQRP